MRKHKPESSQWNVRITTKDAVSGFYAAQSRAVVYLTRGGQDRTTFGSVPISDPEFDDKITTMKAAAMERASALQAVGAV